MRARRLFFKAMTRVSSHARGVTGLEFLRRRAVRSVLDSCDVLSEQETEDGGAGAHVRGCLERCRLVIDDPTRRIFGVRVASRLFSPILKDG